jgi:hypothetical protein
MMLRLIVFALLFPAMAHAQTVRVRSGEHADFSRLALIAPGIQGWTLSKTEAGYQFRASPARLGFDTTSVFNFIPRDRLADIIVDPSGGTLTLVLNCDCPVTAFDYRPGIVVIDIKDSELPSAPSNTLATDAEEPTFLEISQPSPRPLPAPGRARAGSLPDRVLDGFRTARMLRPQVLSQLGVADQPQSEVDGWLQSRLAESLSRSVARGVLVAAYRIDSAPNPSTGSNPIVSLLTPAPQTLAPALILRESGRPPLTPVAKDPCANLPDLAIANWGDERSFSIQLAERRAGVTGEFDRPDPEAIKDLIKLYLFAGFGAEAQALTQVLPGDPEGQFHMQMIAGILDDLPAPELWKLSALRGCTHDVALWALLAPAGSMPPPQLATDSVLGAFLRLPTHLKLHLGPRVITALIDAGAQRPAWEIGAVLKRLPGLDPKVSDWLQARLEPTDSDEPAVQAELDRVSRLLGPAAPEQPVASIGRAMASNSEVTQETITLVESYARQLRDDNRGEALRDTAALAYARNRDFSAALSDPGSLSPSTLGLVFDQLAAAGTDSDLFNLAIQPPAEIISSLTSATRAAVAARFARLDLPELAGEWSGPDRVIPAGVLPILSGPATTGAVGPVAEAVSDEASSLTGEIIALLSELPAIRAQQGPLARSERLSQLGTAVLSDLERLTASVATPSD